MARYTAEIPQTEEECKEVWFGNAKRGNDRWMVVVFFKAMTMAPPGGRIYSGENHIGVITADGRDLIYPDGCILMETKHVFVIDGVSLEACKEETKKACEAYGNNCLGSSLPFRARYPLCVPDTLEELQTMGAN